jgi:diguanylate cyclase (GGDEF)-like protein/PAS domain S-box-containing protein
MQIKSFFQLGIIARLSLGLVSMALSLFLIADIVFDILPNKEKTQQVNREQLAKGLSIQLLTLIQDNNTEALNKTLQHVAINNPEIISIGIRRTDGLLQFFTPNHAKNWHLSSNEASSTDQIRIPIQSNNQSWGNIELSFTSNTQKSWIALLLDSYILWIGAIGLVVAILFYAYLNRVLHYLDPSKAVPSRVDSAFDIIADGIVVLDKNGRLLLANDAFKKLCDIEENALYGKRLSELTLTKPLLKQLNNQLPWEDFSDNIIQLNDVYLETSSTENELLNLLVSSVSIDDDEKNPRGYLVTFKNISELHKTNLKLNETLDELKVSRAKLELKNQQLQEMAYRDPLTGCLNRRAFFEEAENIFASATQANRELFCVMADIDFFKSVNDVYGHYIGDQVIQVVAKTFTSCLRPADLICRYGGEEFCILLADLTEKDALEVCERMRASVEKHANKSIRSTNIKTITSSFGLVSIHSGANSIENLIDYADSALYMSKESGRNRVTQWTTSLLK